MATLMRFKRHPYNEICPNFVLLNPEFVVELVELGDEATVVRHLGGSSNVAHPLDETFYMINNNGKEPAP